MSDQPIPRLDRVGSRPRLSIVVAWQGCPIQLSRRLRTWSRWVSDGVDVLVVCSCPPAERQRLERTHPEIRFVAGGCDQEMRALREAGVAAAKGDIVVIFDDTIGESSTWREHLPAMLGVDAVPTSRNAWGSYENVGRVDDASLR